MVYSLVPSSFFRLHEGNAFHTASDNSWGDEAGDKAGEMRLGVRLGMRLWLWLIFGTIAFLNWDYLIGHFLPHSLSLHPSSYDKKLFFYEVTSMPGDMDSPLKCIYV